MRFADHLETWLPAECPGCGYGMPGSHRKHCPMRAALLRAERVATSEDTRLAFSRVLRAAFGHVNSVKQTIKGKSND